MKLFAIAFGIVCGVAAVLFGVAFVLLRLFEYPQPQAAAGTLAGVVILAFPKVAEFLSSRRAKRGWPLEGGSPSTTFADFRSRGH